MTGEDVNGIWKALAPRIAKDDDLGKKMRALGWEKFVAGIDGALRTLFAKGILPAEKASIMNGLGNITTKDMERLFDGGGKVNDNAFGEWAQQKIEADKTPVVVMPP